MNKLKEMFSSVSFWISVVGAIIIILGQEGVIPMEIAWTIAGWCGYSVIKRKVSPSKIKKPV